MMLLSHTDTILMDQPWEFIANISTPTSLVVVARLLLPSWTTIFLKRSPLKKNAWDIARLVA